MVSKLEKIEIGRKILDDIAYHREKFFKDFNGKPLPFYPPQAEAARKIEKFILARTGDTMTVRICRQFGKNEIEATIQTRMLMRYQNQPMCIIRTAPTYKPQIVVSKKRFRQACKQNRLFDINKLIATEGYIFRYGEAEINFVSSDPNANVEGLTASLYLSIDEAHKVDEELYEEKIGPMGAFQGVSTVLYGVAADKHDLMYKRKVYNTESGQEYNNINIPAEIACEYNKNYARYYEKRVAQLGKDHPVIKTQYDLIDIESIGGYLTSVQIANMQDSDFGRFRERRSGKEYVCLIDVAGESEEEIEGEDQETTEKDSTVVLMVELDESDMKMDYPLCRVVDALWWTGKAMSGDDNGNLGQQELILNFMAKWKPYLTIIDGRGIGEQMGGYLKRRYGGVIVYKANSQTVSEECYCLLSMINNGRVKIFQNDGSPLYEEFIRQLGHTKYEIVNHDLMKIIKPKEAKSGSAALHIDFTKALTYLGRYIIEYQGRDGFYFPENIQNDINITKDRVIQNQEQINRKIMQISLASFGSPIIKEIIEQDNIQDIFFI